MVEQKIQLFKKVNEPNFLMILCYSINILSKISLIFDAQIGKK